MILFIALVMVFAALPHMHAKDVKIVEGQNSDRDTSNSFHSYDGYGGYDSYNDYGDYNAYAYDSWTHSEDDKGNLSEETATEEGTSTAHSTPSGMIKSSNATGPMMMVSMQDQCFKSEEIVNEGRYSFCPYHNISLTYVMRRTEETLPMGWFSHWSTQNMNSNKNAGARVRLTQVYRHGFYCRMGDEHSTIVTFGCLEETQAEAAAAAAALAADGHGAEGDDADVNADAEKKENLSDGFKVTRVSKGSYGRARGSSVSVGGTALKGEMDMWAEEDEGCVYNVHFALPFSCADMVALGFEAPADTDTGGSADLSADADAVGANMEVDGSPSPSPPPVLIDGGGGDNDGILAQWRAWGVRLKDGMGQTEADILSEVPVAAAAAGAGAAASSATLPVETATATAATTNTDTVASASAVGTITVQAPATSSSSSSSGGSSIDSIGDCECCEELAQLKNKLQELV
jgi:hypothetical protein